MHSECYISLISLSNAPATYGFDTGRILGLPYNRYILRDKLELKLNFSLLNTATIGNTPLEKCDYLSEKYACHIYLKKEYFNQNHTSKDRPAWYMIKNAIENQQLKPQDTIVEASSGNTGMGIAYLASKLGYKCCIFVTKDCAREKLIMLRQLGATVFTCDNSNGLKDPDSTQYHAFQYAQNHSNCFFTDQYNNPQNPLAHYETTGPEIWKQTDGNITHFFAGIGTGGTICGVGEYLKQQSNAVHICGMEPTGSILSYYKEYRRTPHRPQDMDKIDGIGRRFVPGIFNPDVVDHILQVDRQDAMQWAMEYYEQSGTLLGFSSAAVIAGLSQYAAHHTIPEESRIVLLFADYGDRYLNSLYHCLRHNQLQYDEKL